MPPSATASELFARMLEVYATTEHYADRGTNSRPLAFRTAFVRGRAFRFSYDGYVIWSDGVHTYTCGAIEAGRVGAAIDDGDDLMTPIASHAGVSRGTAITVPALLLPVTLGQRSTGLRTLGELAIEADLEDVDGHPCVRIAGTSQRGRTDVLWIDRGLHVLRRVLYSRGTQFEGTTSYEPSLEPLDPATVERPDVASAAPRSRPPLAWIGAHVSPVNMLVGGVVPNSPATRSGLEMGDVIVAVGGEPVAGTFCRRLLRPTIGDRIPVTVRRGDRNVEAVLVVEAHPGDGEWARPDRPLVA